MGMLLLHAVVLILIQKIVNGINLLKRMECKKLILNIYQDVFKTQIVLILINIFITKIVSGLIYLI